MREKYLMVVLLVVVCAFHGETCAAQSDKFPLGILLPLSGPVSEMGGSFRRGIELYLADHPEATIQPIYEDHRYDGKTTVTALHALRAKAHNGLIIVWGNTPAGAAAPVSEQQRIPTLAISMNPDAKGRDYVVSVGPPLREVAAEIVERLRSSGVQNAGAVSIDIGNALEGIELVNQSFGGKFVTKIVSSEELDFKPVISQLRARSVDGLVVFLLPQQALTFLKQARQMNYSPEIVGGDVFGVDSFQSEVQKFSSKVGYVYGAVREEFIEHLAKSPAGGSYFFETATGYSIAAMIDRAVLQDKRAPEGREILARLRSVDSSNLPLLRVEYKDTDEFGRHFEVGSKYYSIPSSKDKR